MINYLSKRGYEFSFAWIFAIFVGGVIIFFAIYFATQIVGTQQTARDVSQSKSLGILLTPIETELEEGKFAKIYLTDSTKLYFECKPPSSSNPFGSQNLRMSIKPPLGQKWEDNQAPAVTFHNKYFFATGEPTEFNEIYTEGEKNFYVLSKPLYLPFKIADLMIIYSDKQKFCFENIGQAPPDFRRRMNQINMTNVKLTGPCDPKEYEVVCFGRSCEISIDQNQKKVIKNGKNLYYVLSSEEHDPYAMLYAAIFSDPDNYDCQVKRLMAHASKLVDIYYQKSNYIYLRSATGCNGPEIRSALQSLNTTLASGNILALNQFIGNEDYRNLKESGGGIGCELF